MAVCSTRRRRVGPQKISQDCQNDLLRRPDSKQLILNQKYPPVFLRLSWSSCFVLSIPRFVCLFLVSCLCLIVIVLESPFQLPV